MFSSEAACLLHTSISGAWRELSEHGLLPVQSVDDDRLPRLYHRKDLDLYLERKSCVPLKTDAPSKLPSLEAPSVDEQLCAEVDSLSDTVIHINLDVILKKYDLTAKSFNSAFVKHGFISIIPFSGERYLTTEAARSVSEILDNYYTCRQADKILNRKNQYTRLSVKRGRLHNSNPISTEFFRVLLIKRCDIHRMLYSLPPPKI